MSAAISIALVLVIAAPREEPAEPFAASMQQGWQALQAERWEDARRAYEAAAADVPRSEDAWIGLMRARLGMKDLRGAAKAGERALSLAPENLWAHRFLALTRYLLGEYERARVHYERVRVADAAGASDPLIALGLGLTLVRLGEVENGHRLCREAKTALGDDERVLACLALGEQSGPRLGAMTSVSILRGLDNQVADISAFTALASATWAPTWSLRAGVTLSRAELGGASVDQASPLLGVAVGGKAWSMSLAGVLLTANDATDLTPIVWGRAAYGSDRLGVWLTSALSFYDGEGLGVVTAANGFGDRGQGGFGAGAGSEVTAMSVASAPGTVYQLAAGLTLARPGVLLVAFGPELLVVSDELLISVHASARVLFGSSAWLDLAGHYGTRSYAVDAAGLAVWSSAERQRAGTRVGFGFQLGPMFALGLEGRWDGLEANGSGAPLRHRIGASASLVFTP